nr:unnamed protein product [Spirometra erinaceieuropaei]
MCTSIPADVRKGNRSQKSAREMQSPMMVVHALLLLYIPLSLGLPQPYVTIIMEYHNLARKSVYPGAADMQTMTYDKKLEKLAEEWVSQCVYEHPTSERYKPYGQNLAVAGNRDPLDSLHIAMTLWYAERAEYLGKENYCLQQPCTHYTAMIWANTTKVGCAYNRCDHIFGMKTFLWACQYYPRGNWIGDEPYRKGNACSKCRRGQKCKLRQCL